MGFWIVDGVVDDEEFGSEWVDNEVFTVRVCFEVEGNTRVLRVFMYFSGQYSKGVKTCWVLLWFETFPLRDPE